MNVRMSTWETFKVTRLNAITKAVIVDWKEMMSKDGILEAPILNYEIGEEPAKETGTERSACE